MSLNPSRFVLAAAVATAAAVFSPSVCQAGLFDCFNTSATPAPLTYAPPYEAQRVAWMPTADTCNPCAAPQVNYVPEVKYRWKYSRIERTEYQPVAACDPCSGCPTTSYRPVTKKSLLPWLHREAYTTYRAVPYGGATPVSYMQPSFCSPCATGCDTCGDSGMSAPSLSSGCSSCASGGTTVYNDSAASDPGYSTGQTFESGTEWSPVDTGSDTRLKPSPDVETQKSEEPINGQPTSMPRMVIPSLQPDRTASVSRVRTASYEEPARIVVPLQLVPVQ